MEKITLSALVIAMIAILGTSCTKEATTPAAPGTAMVTLQLGINTDLTNDTTYNGFSETVYENVPSGTMVKFVIDSRDLQRNPVNGYNYEELTYTGTVGANGEVMIELPAIADPANVQVKFPELRLDERRERYNTVTQQDEIITESKIYTRSTVNISVWDGAVLVREYNY